MAQHQVERQRQRAASDESHARGAAAQPGAQREEVCAEERQPDGGDLLGAEPQQQPHGCHGTPQPQRAPGREAAKARVRTPATPRGSSIIARLSALPET